MKRTLAPLFLSAMLTGVAQADGYSVNFAPAQHNVVRTKQPPLIDGVLSDGEWGTRSETECSPSDPGAQCNVADSWVDLQANTPDSHNLRFQMLWDDSHLYILGRSDYAVTRGPGGYVEGRETENVINAPNDPDWNGTGYAASFFFDPNRDDERIWDPEMPVLPDEVDGYQISWDIFQGFSSRGPTPNKPNQSLRDPLDAQGQSMNDYFGGLRLEAHVNAPAGNQGVWDLTMDGPNENYRDDAWPGLIFAQQAYNEDDPATTDIEEEPGAIWEWAIPWEVFNATNPNRLVTAQEAAARPETVLDTRQFIIVDDPDNPGGLIQIENPDVGMMVPNEGQIFGTEAFIGKAGEADMRFADPGSPLFLENGLYAADGPKAGDIWGFEASVFTNDFENSLPSWSEPLGGDPTRGGSFSLWGTVGHGQIKFLPEGDTGFETGNETCTVPTGVLPGDLDDSNSVGFSDFLLLSGNFGESDVGYAGGDIDCDGVVAFADFLVLSGNFGKSAGAAATVPEPSSGMLLAIALGFATAARRRRRVRRR